MSDISVLEHYLAPLQPLLAPGDVTELVVNRPGEAGVERGGEWTWHAIAELTEPWLATLAVAAAAHTRQDISPDHPICSTVLPGGERCQIVIPPAVPTGTVSLTIRKPAGRLLDLSALEAAGLFQEMADAGEAPGEDEDTLGRFREAGDWPAFFSRAVRTRKNILISGATGSGKTTFARSLIQLIPEQERLITIEDARELTAPHRNLVHLTYARDGRGLSTAGPKALLEGALRMRPDRILMQELRDASAFFYLRNVSSGHPGSITTVHADSAAIAFEQLTLLVRESDGGRDLPRDDIRNLLHLLVDVVVQLKRVEGRFRVTEVYYDPVRKRRARL